MAVKVTQLTQTLSQCCFIVGPAGPTIKQHWDNVQYPRCRDMKVAGSFLGVDRKFDSVTFDNNRCRGYEHAERKLAIAGQSLLTFTVHALVSKARTLSMPWSAWRGYSIITPFLVTSICYMTVITRLWSFCFTKIVFRIILVEWIAFILPKYE